MVSYSPLQKGLSPLFSLESLKKREELRGNTDVHIAVEDFWNILELTKDQNGCIDKESYMILNYKLHLALIPGGTFDAKEAHESCLIDWENDCHGEAAIGYEAFFNSLCNLADVWVEQPEPIAYASFLIKLLHTVSYIGRDAQMEDAAAKFSKGVSRSKAKKPKGSDTKNKVFRRFHLDYNIPSLTGRSEDLVKLTAEEHWMLNQKKVPLRTKHLKLQTIMSRTHLVSPFQDRFIFYFSPPSPPPFATAAVAAAATVYPYVPVHRRAAHEPCCTTTSISAVWREPLSSKQTQRQTRSCVP